MHHSNTVTVLSFGEIRDYTHSLPQKTGQEGTEIKHGSLGRIPPLPLDLYLIALSGAGDLNQRGNAFARDSLSWHGISTRTGRRC